MSSFNKVILIGNLTRDPQLSYLPSQMAVVNFDMAINRKWLGQDGQKKEEVCFISLVAFGKSAETINKYCKKGQPLMAEGHLQFDQWTDKDGGKRSKHKVVVENFQFLDSAKKETEPAKEQEKQEQSNDNDFFKTPASDDDKPQL